MKRSGTTSGHRRGRRPTVSDGGLVLVAPASSDVLVWTAELLLHTHNGSSEPEDAPWNHTETFKVE
jgi:hypothetical protein